MHELFIQRKDNLLWHGHPHSLPSHRETYKGLHSSETARTDNKQFYETDKP